MAAPRRPVTSEDRIALGIACPVCKSPAGEWCVRHYPRKGKDGANATHVGKRTSYLHQRRYLRAHKNLAVPEMEIDPVSHVGLPYAGVEIGDRVHVSFIATVFDKEANGTVGVIPDGWGEDALVGIPASHPITVLERPLAEPGEDAVVRVTPADIPAFILHHMGGKWMSVGGAYYTWSEVLGLGSIEVLFDPRETA